MPADERANARTRIIHPGRGATFLLRTAGGDRAVTRIIDASLSGAGLLTRYPLTPGERIRLSHRRADGELSLDALVAWCTAHPAELYTIGVSFDPADRPASAAFFLSLRPYLSPLARSAPGA